MTNNRSTMNDLFLVQKTSDYVIETEKSHDRVTFKFKTHDQPASFTVTPEYMPKESYILIMPNGNISCDFLEITKKLRERVQLLMLQKIQAQEKIIEKYKMNSDKNNKCTD